MGVEGPGEGRGTEGFAVIQRLVWIKENGKKKTISLRRGNFTQSRGQLLATTPFLSFTLKADLVMQWEAIAFIRGARAVMLIALRGSTTFSFHSTITKHRPDIIRGDAHFFYCVLS